MKVITYPQGTKRKQLIKEMEIGQVATISPWILDSKRDTFKRVKCGLRRVSI